MQYQLFLIRLNKLIQALLSKRFLLALIRYRVLASAEHRHILSQNFKTIVDIGANRGQFALAARQWSPNAHVISFEPLDNPAAIFRQVFLGDDRVTLYQAAIGPDSQKQKMHVSARDDSSSLLPISSLQTTLFPGTEEQAIAEVAVAPLSKWLTADDLPRPSLLKLDVQGFESEALRGCESLLTGFDWVYCECSFVELYSGQKLASEIINWLSARGFYLTGMFNCAYDHQGQAIQADFLFALKENRDETI